MQNIRHLVMYSKSDLFSIFNQNKYTFSSVGVRNWSIWEHAKNYFSVDLVETAYLAPDSNYYLICAFPHGVCVKIIGDTDTS